MIYLVRCSVISWTAYFFIQKASEMRATIIQTDLHWENATANRTAFSTKFTPLIGQTDLVVLPEMFTTGFSMETEKLAETMNGTTVNWMKDEAKRLDAAITGSLIIEEKGQYYNRLVWAFPNGEIQHYDKKHLFKLGNEHQSFSAGDEKLIISYKGWKICPLICYDLRFPVWARNVDNYDLLIYIASWPQQRRAAWRTLLKARAIENQSYVVGVNRIGTDGSNLSYAGDSTIIDYVGNTCVEITHNEGIFTMELDQSKRAVFTQKLPFLNDRDLFELS